MNKNIIEGLKRAIDVCRSTIDQRHVENFCDHIGVTQSYFKSETINKIVTALEKEIKTLEA